MTIEEETNCPICEYEIKTEWSAYGIGAVRHTDGNTVNLYCRICEHCDTPMDGAFIKLKNGVEISAVFAIEDYDYFDPVIKFRNTESVEKFYSEIYAIRGKYLCPCPDEDDVSAEYIHIDLRDIGICIAHALRDTDLFETRVFFSNEETV